MEIPTDLAGILASVGVPVGAVVSGYLLVRGADALEKDASDDALRHISGLLKTGPLTGFGALGARVVPLVFDKIFGSRPLSLKFIFRSILASMTFWLVLFLLEHSIWQTIWPSIENTWVFLPIILLADWMSLTKARMLLNIMSKR